AVIGLAQQVQAIHGSRCWAVDECAKTNFSACWSRLSGAECVSTDESPSGICSSKASGFIQSTERSAVTIPMSLPTGPSGNLLDIAALDSICQSQMNEDDMQDAFYPHSGDPSPELVHYGSYSGILRLFPGLPQEECGACDPR
ncbi:unnamed protein product, partial [Chrysoparadoxa australica]